MDREPGPDPSYVVAMALLQRFATKTSETDGNEVLRIGGIGYSEGELNCIVDILYYERYEVVEFREYPGGGESFTVLQVRRVDHEEDKD